MDLRRRRPISMSLAPPAAGDLAFRGHVHGSPPQRAILDELGTTRSKGPRELSTVSSRGLDARSHSHGVAKNRYARPEFCVTMHSAHRAQWWTLPPSKSHMYEHIPLGRTSAPLRGAEWRSLLVSAGVHDWVCALASTTVVERNARRSTLLVCGCGILDLPFVRIMFVVALYLAVGQADKGSCATC